MAKCTDSMLFPGGKKRALTLSYDDGVRQDRRLVEILNHFGLKATFNINAGLLSREEELVINGKSVDVSKIAHEEVSALYRGHEVAAHGLWHSSLTDIAASAAMFELTEDKHLLERITGKLVRSFAYPFGTFSDEVKEMLRLAGFESARTVISTGEFTIPRDFLAWEATCHHSDPALMELARRFCCEEALFGRSQLFYLWGHAYEFDADDNWSVIEDFARYMAGYADRIWFVTNGDFRDYVNSYRQLRVSADGRIVYNPTAAELWMEIHEAPARIGPGETVSLRDTNYEF
ncbi:MAG: polysaccharide deacetylase family protein [Oscillospiraceae bacterium]|nr:polysaccharide deacetylase family protein [Oscillospiraceae bacterium]